MSFLLRAYIVHRKGRLMLKIYAGVNICLHCYVQQREKTDHSQDMPGAECRLETHDQKITFVFFAG